MARNFFRVFLATTVVQSILIGQTTFDAGSSHLQAGIGFPNWYANQSLKELENEVKYYNEYTNAFAHSYSSEKNVSGPYFLRYEYALKNQFGIGLVLGYSDFLVSANNNYSVVPLWTQTEESHLYRMEKKFVSYTIGFRFNYHVLKNTKLDPYAGIALGYTYSKITTRIESTQFQSTSPYPHEYNETGIPFYIAISLGIRYYPVKSLALYAEVGADMYSIVQTGLVYKFNQ